MDIRLPNGTVLTNVPDDATQSFIYEKLQSNGIDPTTLGLEEPKQAFAGLRQAADIPIGFAKGIASGIRGISEGLGADNEFAQNVQGVEDFLGDLLSAQYRKDAAAQQKVLAEARDKGLLANLQAAYEYLKIAPADTIANLAGTSAPYILGAIYGGVPAAVGLGVAGGMGAVKREIYDAVKEELTASTDLPPEDIETKAQLAQSYGGENLDQILLGGAVGGAASGLGIERGVARVLSSKILGRVAAKPTAEQLAEETAKKIAETGAKKGYVEIGGDRLATRFAKGVAAEAIPEAAQEGQERLAANIALQRQGFDVPTMEGVTQAATLGGTLGAVLGGPFEAAFGQRPTRIDVPPPAATAPGTEPGAEPAPEEPAIPGAEPAPEPTEVPPTAEVEPAPSVTPEVEPPVATEVPPVDVEPAPEPEAPIATEPTPEAPAAPTSPYIEGDPLEGDHLNLPVFALPKPLAGAKPKYNYRTDGSYTPFFFNDVDKALFIVAQPTKSSKDAEYRAFLKSVGFDDKEIDIRAKEARQHIKNLAASNYNAGKKSGLIPVDFSRLSSFYPNIISKAAVPEAPAAAPSPTAAPPASAPTPTTPTAASPIAPTTTTFEKQTDQTLDSFMPGASDVLRQVQRDLFPGSNFTFATNNKMSALGRTVGGRQQIVGGTKVKGGVLGGKLVPGSRIELNFSKAKKYTKVDFLQTVFHEVGHLVEDYWIRTADVETRRAIFQQFTKEKNLNAFERFMFGRVVYDPNRFSDTSFEEFLKAANITEQQFNRFIKSEKVPSDVRTSMKSLGINSPANKYYQKFSEWVAEKGARWLANELEGRLPKTVLEKFQSDILRGLKDIFVYLSRLIGLEPTEGAFEKLLKEVYGVETRVPDIGKTRQSKFITQETDIAPKVAPVGEPVAEPEVSPIREMAAPTVEPTTTQPPPTLGELNTLMTASTPVNDDTWYNKALADLIGREKIVVNGKLVYEPIMRAIIRSTVSANLPFLEKPAFREVGKLLESLQNMQGRMVGMIKYGYVTYNPETKEFDFKSYLGKDKDPEGLLGGLGELFKKAGSARQGDLQVLTIAMRQRDLILAKKPKLSFVNPNTKREFTLDELNQIIKNAPADLKEIAENYRKFNNGMLKFALDSGIITKEQQDVFLSTMYTPFYRRQDDALKGDSNLTLSPEMKDLLDNPDNITDFSRKLKEGASFEKLDPDFYANVFKNYSAIVTMGLKNIAYSSVYNAWQQAGRDKTLIEDVGKGGGDSVITFRVEGGEKHMKINDLSMFQALAAFSPKQLEGWARAMQRFTDLLRTAITSMPGFQLANLWRGIVDTHIKTGMPLGTLAFDTLKLMGQGFWQTLRQGYLSNTSYRAIIAQQGFGGYNIGSRAKDQSEFLLRQYAANEGTQTFKQRVMSMVDRLEEMGEVSEMAPRIAYYNWLMKSKADGGMGKSRQEAAYEAMNLINFGRSGTGRGVFGSGIAMLIPLVPFLNARIQGLYRLMENQTAGGEKAYGFEFKQSEKAYGFPQAIMLRGLMLTVLELMLLSAFQDEDWYDKLSVEDKVANNYVRVGDTIIAFPRPFELGSLFGAIPALFLDAVNKEQPKEFTDGLSHILLQTFSFNAIPQAVKPLIDVYYANRDSFTGQQIETIAEQRRSENERMDEYTTEIAKGIAQVVPKMSPKQADALIKGYLGTFGSVMAGLIDGVFAESGTKPAGYFGDPAQAPAVLANTLGLNRFFKTEETMRNRYVKDFYDVQRTVEEITLSIKDAADAKDFELVREKVQADPRARGLATTLNRVESQINDINARMRNIRKNPNLSSSQKTEYINQLRARKNELAKQAYNIARQVGYE